MIEPIIIDTEYNSVSALVKRLSICLTINGFSFSIVDDKSRLLAFGDLEMDYKKNMTSLISDIKRVFEDKSIDLFSFEKKELVVTTDKNVIIPSHLYTPSGLRSYLQTLHKIENTETVASSYIESIDAYTVFSVDNTTLSAFKIAIPTIAIHSQFDFMVSSVVKNKVGAHAFLNIRDCCLDICLSSQGKLLLTNTVCFTSETDIIYTVLNIMKQLGIDSEEVSIVYAGKVTPSLFDSTQRFIKNVKLYTFSASINNDEIKRKPLYEYPFIDERK